MEIEQVDIKKEPDDADHPQSVDSKTTNETDQIPMDETPAVTVATTNAEGSSVGVDVGDQKKENDSDEKPKKEVDEDKKVEQVETFSDTQTPEVAVNQKQGADDVGLKEAVKESTEEEKAVDAKTNTEEKLENVVDVKTNAEAKVEGDGSDSSDEEEDDGSDSDSSDGEEVQKEEGQIDGQIKKSSDSGLFHFKYVCQSSQFRQTFFLNSLNTPFHR